MSYVSIEDFDRAFSKEPVEVASEIATAEEAFDAIWRRGITEAQRDEALEFLAAESRSRDECDALIDELAALHRSRRGLRKVEAEVRAKSDVMEAIEKAPTLSEAVVQVKRVRNSMIREVAR
ncbi:hypothetical protein [Aeromicrobium sp. CnD17-E]|uniref:hypothetical protein n=1 Tax=Aeromicrobium sp. CnD17-E TaxID=2954487 RepID=UPI002096F108|nr:hypothetical protein [Aeromicrobium sp. CnD17-E]MCO7238695.1 hypothetical protein [Aeromicrobium sp. CnD17-E]